MSKKRIICLTEETTELFYLLGEQDRIAGVSRYTKRPEHALKEKPQVCSFLKGNIEKIEKIKPDLIIGFSDVQADLAAQLIRKGFDVLITNQRSIQEIFETMIMLGTLVDQKQATEHLVKGWIDKLEKLKEKYAKLEQPVQVFLQEWDKPILCGIRWCSELLSYLGATHVFGEQSFASKAEGRVIDEELVASANPQVIIGSWCGKKMNKDWVLNHPAWQQVEAIEKKLVFEIDSTIFLQPGPALFSDGVDMLEKILNEARLTIYPEAYAAQ